MSLQTKKKKICYSFLVSGSGELFPSFFVTSKFPVFYTGRELTTPVPVSCYSAKEIFVVSDGVGSGDPYRIQSRR